MSSSSAGKESLPAKTMEDNNGKLEEDEEKIEKAIKMHRMMLSAIKNEIENKGVVEEILQKQIDELRQVKSILAQRGQQIEVELKKLDEARLRIVSFRESRLEKVLSELELPAMKKYIVRDPRFKEFLSLISSDNVSEFASTPLTGDFQAPSGSTQLGQTKISQIIPAGSAPQARSQTVTTATGEQSPYPIPNNYSSTFNFLSSLPNHLQHPFSFANSVESQVFTEQSNFMSPTEPNQFVSFPPRQTETRPSQVNQFPSMASTNDKLNMPPPPSQSTLIIQNLSTQKVDDDYTSPFVQEISHEVLRQNAKKSHNTVVPPIEERNANPVTTSNQPTLPPQRQSTLSTLPSSQSPNISFGRSLEPLQNTLPSPTPAATTSTMALEPLPHSRQDALPSSQSPTTSPDSPLPPSQQAQSPTTSTCPPIPPPAPKQSIESTLPSSTTSPDDSVQTPTTSTNVPIPTEQSIQQTLQSAQFPTASASVGDVQSQQQSIQSMFPPTRLQDYFLSPDALKRSGTISKSSLASDSITFGKDDHDSLKRYKQHPPHLSNETQKEIVVYKFKKAPDVILLDDQCSFCQRTLKNKNLVLAEECFGCVCHHACATKMQYKSFTDCPGKCFSTQLNNDAAREGRCKQRIVYLSSDVVGRFIQGYYNGLGDSPSNKRQEISGTSLLTYIGVGRKEILVENDVVAKHTCVFANDQLIQVITTNHVMFT